MGKAPTWAKTFINFLRKLIVGEDWVAAVIIFWGIITVHTFSEVYYMNVWYLLPIIVSAALLVSLGRGKRQYAGADHKRKPSMSICLSAIGLPMILATILPVIVLYITGSETSIRYLVLPVVVANLGFAFITTILLYKQFIKYPLGSSLIAGIIAVLITVKLQPYFLSLFTDSRTLTETIIVITCYVLTLVFLTVQRLRARSNS